MLTHRMVSARGQLSSSKITQAASIAGYTGKFVDFSETATNFQDKIGSANFIPFANLTDVDATAAAGKPYALAWNKVATSSAWGDMGSDDFIIMFGAEASVNVSLGPAHSEATGLTSNYVPNGTDVYYGGSMSLYVGANALSVTLQPYYVLFRYSGSNTTDQAFTAWNDKYNLKENGDKFAFAAVKRGDELLHLGYKYGDSSAEILGSIDTSTIDTLRGDTTFSTKWNAASFGAEIAMSHGAYGCTADRCRYIETDNSGNELWKRDKTGAVCGNPQHAGWPVTTFPPSTLQPVQDTYPRDAGDLSYHWPSAPNPILGQCSESGPIDHPQKYYFATLLKLANGSPSDASLKNALKYSLDRSVDDGVKAVDPSLIYGL